MPEMAAAPTVFDDLYTADGWAKRRKLLFRLIAWEVVLATLIIVVALFTRRTDATTIPLLTTLVTVVVPALLATIAAQTYTYVFGAVQDDKDKREKLPPPRINNEAGEQPPDGFADQ